MANWIMLLFVVEHWEIKESWKSEKPNSYVLFSDRGVWKYLSHSDIHCDY